MVVQQLEYTLAFQVLILLSIFSCFVFAVEKPRKSPVSNTSVFALNNKK